MGRSVVGSTLQGFKIKVRWARQSIEQIGKNRGVVGESVKQMGFKVKVQWKSHWKKG